jgi:Protein of unknown function (DUF642)
MRTLGRALALAVAVGVVVAAALASVVSASETAGVNLIKNGGFEQPVVAVGGYSLYSPGQSFSGWRVVGATGNVAPIGGKYTSAGFLFVAKAGRQWLDLTGLSNTATGIAQTVATTAGASYRLSFSVGNIVEPGGIFGTRSTVVVLVNGRRLLAATNSAGRKSRQSWKSFAVTVKATSGATTIEFRNGDSHTDDEDGLDAVALRKR